MRGVDFNSATGSYAVEVISDTRGLPSTFWVAIANNSFNPNLTTQPRIPLPELVDGGNISLVPAEDAQALANAILRLAADPELRRTLGAGAMALSQQFRWQTIAADTLTLYRTIGAGR